MTWLLLSLKVQSAKSGRKNWYSRVSWHLELHKNNIGFRWTLLIPSRRKIWIQKTSWHRSKISSSSKAYPQAFRVSFLRPKSAQSQLVISLSEWPRSMCWVPNTWLWGGKTTYRRSQMSLWNLEYQNFSSLRDSRRSQVKDRLAPIKASKAENSWRRTCGDCATRRHHRQTAKTIAKNTTHGKMSRNLYKSSTRTRPSGTNIAIS